MVYNGDKQKRIWITCPTCGKRLIPVFPGTRLIEFPLLCKICKQESIVDFDGHDQSLSRRA